MHLEKNNTKLYYFNFYECFRIIICLEMEKNVNSILKICSTININLHTLLCSYFIKNVNCSV